MLTVERRTINPKFGRQSVEFNACRWLLFSNHESAIPLDATDRRFEVCAYDGSPKSEAYYTRLYGLLLRRPAFINDVAEYLGRRDISGFNPGRHARTSLAKQGVISVTASEGRIYADAVAQHWPADVISNRVLSEILDPAARGAVTPAVRRLASEAGLRRHERVLKVNGEAGRVYLIRNHEQWMSAGGASLAAEATRCMPPDAFMNWRSFLDDIIARAA